MRKKLIETMDTFYQLTQLNLTEAGVKYRALHPESAWGCLSPLSETESRRLYAQHCERRERRGRPPMSFGLWTKRHDNEECSFELFNSSVRGFFKNKDDFAKLIGDEQANLHGWISEGYYERFIITPKVFGIDVMPEDWKQLYYALDEKTDLINPCEAFEGFEHIHF